MSIFIYIYTHYIYTYMYIYIYMYKHTYIYIYICICICESSPGTPTPLLPRPKWYGPPHSTPPNLAFACYLQHLKATTSHTTVPKTCLCNAYNYLTHGLPLMYTIHSVPMHTCNPIYAWMQYVPTNILPKYRYPPNVSCLCVVCTLLHHYLYAPYTLHLLPTHVS